MKMSFFTSLFHSVIYRVACQIRNVKLIFDSLYQTEAAVPFLKSTRYANFFFLCQTKS
jgi:hypothetical protein